MQTQRNWQHSMKLSRATEGFLLNMHAESFSENTVRIYEWGLKLLIEFSNDPEMENITPELLSHFMVWLKKDYVPKRPGGSIAPLSPASIENAWIAIRSFYNWAEVELEIDRPDGKLKRPKYKSKIITPLTQQEIDALLSAANKTRNKKRDRAIILLLLDTGLRVSELARLRIKDIDLEIGAITVEPWGTAQKTKGRIVYIGKATRKALWLYLADQDEVYENDPLFLTQDNRPMRRNTIRFMLARHAKLAGVKEAYPHKLRHTFAIEFLRNGGDVFSLQRLLGHSTLDMVKTYVKLADTDTAKVHRSASPVDRWRL